MNALAELMDADAFASHEHEERAGRMVVDVTPVRTVTIPARVEHEGIYSRTVRLAWVCPTCGAPRGEVAPTISYDGSRRLHVDGWANLCGHVDKYADVRKEADTNGLNSAPLAWNAPTQPEMTTLELPLNGRSELLGIDDYVLVTPHCKRPFFGWVTDVNDATGRVTVGDWAFGYEADYWLDEVQLKLKASALDESMRASLDAWKAVAEDAAALAR